MKRATATVGRSTLISSTAAVDCGSSRPSASR
jgi:hypothetical protein